MAGAVDDSTINIVVVIIIIIIIRSLLCSWDDCSNSGLWGINPFVLAVCVRGPGGGDQLRVRVGDHPAERSYRHDEPPLRQGEGARRELLALPDSAHRARPGADTRTSTPVRGSAAQQSRGSAAVRRLLRRLLLLLPAETTDDR